MWKYIYIYIYYCIDAYVYMFISLHICFYIYTYTDTDLLYDHIYKNMYICLCLYFHEHIYRCIFMYICVYIMLCVYEYVCIKTQETDGRRDAASPLPKKDDLRIAKNYPGIILTSIAAKIYNALLHNRIEPNIENILRKNQNGFRRNRSTMSQILTIH